MGSPSHAHHANTPVSVYCSRPVGPPDNATDFTRHPLDPIPLRRMLVKTLKQITGAVGLAIWASVSAAADPVDTLRNQLAAGQYREAAEQSRTIANSLPENTPPEMRASIDELRGRALFYTGEYDDAVMILNETLAYLRANGLEQTTTSVNVLLDIGQVLDAQVQPQKARAIFLEAKQICEARFPDDDLLNARMSFHLAEHVEQAELTRDVCEDEVPADTLNAVSLAENSLRLRERHLPATHPDILWARRQIASAMCDEGEVIPAFLTAAAALETAESALPPDHPCVSQLYSDLGYLNIVLKDPGLRQAELNFLRCYSSELTTFGQEHPYTINSLALLGETKRGQGEFAASKHYLTKALAILRKKTMSRGVANVLQLTLCCYASTCLKLGKQDEALECLIDAKDLVSEHFGDKTIRFGEILQLIGNYYLEIKEPVKARTWLTQARRHFEETRPDGTLALAAVFDALAQSYVQTNDLELALSSQLKSLAVRKDALGAEAVETAEGYKALGQLLRRADKPEQAMEAYETALNIFDRKLSKGSDTARETRREMAIVAKQTSNFGLARQLLEKQLSIDLTTLGERNEETAFSRMALGYLLLNQFGEPYAAEQLFQQAASFYEGTYQSEKVKQGLLDANKGLESALRARFSAVRNRIQSLEQPTPEEDDRTSMVQ